MILWLLMLLIYLGGTLSLHRMGWRLRTFVWGAFGLAFLLVQLSLRLDLHVHLAGIEAIHLQQLVALAGIEIEIIDGTTMLVPDNTGWTGMTIGIESSTLIEISVFSGLILFYPRFSRKRRFGSLLIGIIGTYLLNLLRLLIVVAMVVIWGKPAFVIAHTLVGRLVYFAGVVALYWYLFTTPTLSLIRRKIEDRHR